MRGENQFKGRCPECGAFLVKRHFVDTWDAEGNPEDEGYDWYCVWCKLRWQPDDAIPEGEVLKEVRS